jgi:biopolymer transport protein ExbD
MSFGSFDSGASRPMVEINTTPLVDVMLVLLIIFLVTAPLMTQSIPLDLPQTKAQTVDDKARTIRLSLDREGQLYWDDTPFDGEGENRLQTLESRLLAMAASERDLEVRLSADRDSRYQQIAEIMAVVKRAGIVKLGFVIVPEE